MFDKKEYMKGYNKEYNAKNKESKHDYNRRYQENLNPLFRKFYKMQERCRTHPLYIERGIQVLFKDKYEFAEWATHNGWQPGYDIHRKNEYGHYCKENCEFLPHDTHAQETNINNSKCVSRSDGVTYKSITECAKLNNTSVATTSRAIKSGRQFNGYYFTNIGV